MGPAASASHYRSYASSSSTIRRHRAHGRALLARRGTRSSPYLGAGEDPRDVSVLGSQSDSDPGEGHAPLPVPQHRRVFPGINSSGLACGRPRERLHRGVCSSRCGRQGVGRSREGDRPRIHLSERGHEVPEHCPPWTVDLRWHRIQLRRDWAYAGHSDARRLHDSGECRWQRECDRGNDGPAVTDALAS